MKQNLNIEAIDTHLKQVITVDQAWAYRIIPVEKKDDKLTLAIDESQNLSQIKDELMIMFDLEISFIQATEQEINKLLNKFYLKSKVKQSSEGFNVNSSDFLEKLISEANALNCSDIHLESYDDTCRVRMRIDGKLVERFILDKQDYPLLINKIKIMSNLDISEKRLPQDGRIMFERGLDKFDIRVSILPTLFGEKGVLRILKNDLSNVDINKLGFTALDAERYQSGIKKPNGMVLISGPTGSGKTTTLYATLRVLNNKTSNLLTIEDPIEYTLEGVNQVQLRSDIGLDFSKALKTFLRQDPDIIMVGEIRDVETANMAVRAALTGHLVLSTVHTNSAWGIVSRLLEMGISPFLLASTLNVAVAQRLVRVLCEHCKVEEKLTEDNYPSILRGYPHIENHKKAVGCNQCFHTGYKGRKAIYEVIPVTGKIRSLIKDQKEGIANELQNEKIASLGENAFKLLEEGLTSLEEIYPLLLNEI